MSLVLATKAVIVSRLTANLLLKQALAKDPQDPFTPAVFEGTYNTTDPVHPCVTFRLKEHRPDERFRATAAEGGGQSPIFGATLEIECWDDRAASSVRIEQIADAVCDELDGQPLTVSGGRGFHNVLEVRSEPMPDKERKVRFILLRFKLTLQSHIVHS